MHHHRQARDRAHQHKKGSRLDYGAREGPAAQLNGSPQIRVTQYLQAHAIRMNDLFHKVDNHNTRTIAATVTGALAAVVEDNKAHMAWQRILRGAATMTHMLLRVEDMAARRNHNTVRKVDALACRADHACDNHCLRMCSRGAHGVCTEFT